MTTVRMFPTEVAKLGHEQDVVAMLGERAEQVRSRVKAPRKMQLSTRRGVGPRGAFAQVIMRGDGALAIEFGSRNNAPLAPLRRALRGTR